MTRTLKKILSIPSLFPLIHAKLKTNIGLFTEQKFWSRKVRFIFLQIQLPTKINSIEILLYIRYTNGVTSLKMCKFTYKFICAWELKELDQPIVIPSGNGVCSIGHMGTDDIRIVSIARPYSNHFIAQGTTSGSMNKSHLY